MSTEIKGKELLDCDCEHCHLTGEQSQAFKQLNKEVLDILLFDPKAHNALKGGLINITVQSLEIQDISPFSVFNEKHVRTAHDAAVQLSRKPKETMLKALKYLRTAYPKSPYIEHLVRLTFARHPETKEASLPPSRQTLPVAYFTQDEIFEGMNGQKQAVDSFLAGPMRSEDGQQSKGKFDKERDLAWWREDIGLLEHNYSWHLNYPYPPISPRDRQGELFGYMHQQMLARYDFERLAQGYDRVQPYGPGYGWDRPLAEGYNPRMMLCSFRPADMYVAKPDGNPDPRAIHAEMAKHKERLQDGIARGSLYNRDEVKIPVDMNNLGNTILANAGSINKNLYGEINNKGHQVIANLNDPKGKYQISPGPMNWDQTAPRDPVFYRWHKFVDLVFDDHRRNMKPHTKKDIEFPGIEIESFEVELQPEEYHKKNVDKPLDKKNNFYTYSETKEYSVFNVDPQQKVTIKKKDFLDHIPFTYKIALKNKNKSDVMVCFRIFLAPETRDESLENWRSMFVELDRFVITVEAGNENEIFDIKQRNNKSSVANKAQLTVEDIEAGKDDMSHGNCCGWPLNLLIPKGTKHGMKGTLYVLATDWTKDGFNPQEPMQGAVSYCGQRGEKSMYPDMRPMGFPFDKQVVDSNDDPIDDVEGLVEQVRNSFKTDVKLNFLGSWAKEEEKKKKKQDEKKKDSGEKKQDSVVKKQESVEKK